MFVWLWWALMPLKLRLPALYAIVITITEWLIFCGKCLASVARCSVPVVRCLLPIVADNFGFQAFPKTRNPVPKTKIPLERLRALSACTNRIVGNFCVCFPLVFPVSRTNWQKVFNSVSQSTASNGRVWQTKAHEKFMREKCVIIINTTSSSSSSATSSLLSESNVERPMNGFQIPKT